MTTENLTKFQKRAADSGRTTLQQLLAETCMDQLRPKGDSQDQDGSGQTPHAGVSAKVNEDGIRQAVLQVLDNMSESGLEFKPGHQDQGGWTELMQIVAYAGYDGLLKFKELGGQINQEARNISGETELDVIRKYAGEQGVEAYYQDYRDIEPVNKEPAPSPEAAA